MAPYILCSIILLLGVYAVVAKKNLIKIVIGLLIIEYAVNLMLVLVGYRSGPAGALGDAPILTQASQETAHFVDPLPQALVVTSIVIGLGLTAMVVALCIRLYEKYGTLDVLLIRRLRG
jgi:multicomponent Na+:H+ antiporter subunit C